MPFILLIFISIYHVLSGAGRILPPSREPACPQTWPQLQLFLPLNTHNNFWKMYFFQSLLLFWPLEISHTGVVIVADEEVRTHTEQHVRPYITSTASRIPGGLTLTYNPPSIYYGDKGYDRQQYIMFYPENYTSAEYVGFVDTDTMFFTYVGYTDLFEGGKPIIHGRSGPFGKEEFWAYVNLWKAMSQSTLDLLGIAEPTRCMAYFPVVIKASHLIELRAFLERRHGLSFPELFLKHLIGMHYSQFNIMCTYLWAYHQDEYVWYIHELQPNWDYLHPPAWPGQDTNLSRFRDEMRYQKPRIAMHVKYRAVHDEILENLPMLHDILALGICLSPPLPRKEPYCQLLQDYEHVLIDDYFKFEHMTWVPVIPAAERLAIQRDRYHQIAACNHSSTDMDKFAAMNLLSPAEGDVYYTKAEGRAIYMYTNRTLRRVPNWDTYLAMKLPDSKGMSHRLFTLIPKGPDLPACTNC